MTLINIQDFANPLVRPFLQFYPERTNGFVSETWHGEKWEKEMGPDQLTPMAIGRDKQHYYVRELAYTTEGEFKIPEKWVIVDGRLCGECFPVYENVRFKVYIIHYRLTNGSKRTTYGILIKEHAN